MRFLAPELPAGLEIKINGASCFRWCGAFTLTALVLVQLLIELDVVGGENDQEPPAVLFGSVVASTPASRPPPDTAWCRAARGRAPDQRHACSLIAHQVIPEAVALEQLSHQSEQIGASSTAIDKTADMSAPWVTSESLLATLRAGITRLDLDVFSTQGSDSNDSLLIGHPWRIQKALELARPPSQHTAAEIAEAAEVKFWPAPLTLKDLLTWMSTTGAGQQVESITLEPKRDETLPESVYIKLLDDVFSAPGLDARTAIIFRSVQPATLCPHVQSPAVANRFYPTVNMHVELSCLS